MQDSPFSISPGRVLRVWREYAGVTAADLARALPAQPSTVSMWENDQRGRKTAASLANIKAVAAKLEQLSDIFSTDDGAAMVGMWQAASSVDVLPSHPVWFHNFPAPPGPVWVWLRVSPQIEYGKTVLEIGPFDQEFPIPGAGGGLIVHSPTSITNPPLKVIFQEPGWADFGAGTIPPAVAQSLRITMAAARDLIGRHEPHTPPLDKDEERALGLALTNMRRITTHLGGQWSALAPHFGVLRPARRLVYALDEGAVETSGRPADAVTDDSGALVSQLMMTPRQIKAIRNARGLSRAAAAQEATEHDATHPLSERSLETLETDGRVPAARFVLSRLDMIYRTDGRLGIDRTFDSRADASWGTTRRHTLTFPQFWCGHVWFQPRGQGPGDIGEIELVWELWRRRQRVRSGTVITTRKATPEGTELTVRLPPGWHLTAGMGAVPSALDVNAGWWPVSVVAALVLVRDYCNAVGKSLMRSRSSR